MKILITGGAGFIGSQLIRYLIAQTNHVIVNVDNLTYASQLNALALVSDSDRYFFEKADICCETTMMRIFKTYQPDAVMHLAAESHVDRSIGASKPFIQTNIIGTYVLLECARSHWSSLSSSRQKAFRFHHISTDEVYGDLEDPDALFTESTSYAPSSPYSASKASADHLVRAWYRTYGLPILVTNCSNNYGPYQFPEKLIPLTIMNALLGKPLTIYGNGQQIRDWLYVADHVRALYQVLERGAIGSTYNIGGTQEKTNMEVVTSICSLLEELAPQKPKSIRQYVDLIHHVSDRPGHDKRYAIDASKISRELGWSPLETFETGLRKTVQWYLEKQFLLVPGEGKKERSDLEEEVIL